MDVHAIHQAQRQFSAAYGHFIDRGYSVGGYVDPNEVGEFKRALEERGLEVEVTSAFDAPQKRVLFVKERQVQTPVPSNNAIDVYV